MSVRRWVCKPTHLIHKHKSLDDMEFNLTVQQVSYIRKLMMNNRFPCSLNLTHNRAEYFVFHAAINQKTGIQHEQYILYKALLENRLFFIVFKAYLRRNANDWFSGKVKAVNLPIGLILTISHLTTNHIWIVRLYDDQSSGWQKVTSTSLFDRKSSLFYWLFVWSN